MRDASPLGNTRSVQPLIGLRDISRDNAVTDATPDPSQSLVEVQALYTELAEHPEKDFGWGKGKENAHALGYDERWLDQLPPPVWTSAAAVGNPFALGPINAGETVVDLGCGAGADLCIALSRRRAGASGRDRYYPCYGRKGSKGGKRP